MPLGEMVIEKVTAAETHERILQRTRRIVEQSKQLAALNAIASSVNQSLDFDHTLNSAIALVLELMEFEAGWILLRDPSGEARLKAQYGLSEQVTNLMEQLRLNDEFISSVVTTDQPLIEEIIQNDTGLLGKQLRREGFQFLVVIPLRAKGNTLGVLVLDNDRPRQVDADSDQFLASVGEVIGMAIENAALYQNVATLLEETKLQAEQLQRSEQQFRTVIESATDAVAILQDGRFRYVNSYGVKMLGYTVEEARDFTFLDLVRPDYREEVAKNYLKRLQGEIISPYDIVVVRKDGTELPVSINGCRIEYEGRPAVLVIARDITEPKLLREQVLQAEKMSALGQLISGVAHELNNPLTTVIGYSELMGAEEGLSESLRDDLQAVYEAGLRARRIVQNLLMFARQHRPQKSLVDINDLLERTLALRAYEMKVSNIEVVKKLAPDLPLTVADAHQLQQVFLNLLINAEQAMLEGHGCGQLVVQTTTLPPHPLHQLTASSKEGMAANIQHSTVSETIEVIIADDGPGIPAAHLNRIFEPFFTTKPTGKGTGLGLSISHSIIQDHSGRISVRSQPDKGATFIIELPVAKQPEAVSTDLPEALLPQQVPAKSVLIIDDEPAIVRLLAKIAATEGHRTDTASDGREALNKLQQHSYDLIFCDIKMPQLSGPDLYQELRYRNGSLLRRMVFITGDVVNEETRTFLERSGACFIEKPFTNEAIIQMMRLLV